MPSSAAHADAAIDVTISTVGDTWTGIWLPADHEINVTNPGTEPLGAVTVTPSSPRTSTVLPDTVTGPTIVVGNDDEVLEPGEEWLYRATSQSPGVAEVVVTATTPSGQTVSDTARIPIGPYSLTITPSTLIAVSGDTVEWTVEATNATRFALPHRVTSGRLFAYNDGGEPISLTDESPMKLVDQGDGDDSWDPGETWRWSYEAVVTVDGTILAASVNFNNPDGTVTGMVEFAEPIRVEPGPDATVPEPSTTTPEPSGTLPETGGGATTTGLAALAVVLLGSLLAAISRRNVTAHTNG